jgi:hypothetical protein
MGGEGSGVSPVIEMYPRDPLTRFRPFLSQHTVVKIPPFTQKTGSGQGGSHGYKLFCVWIPESLTHPNPRAIPDKISDEIMCDPLCFSLECFKRGGGRQGIKMYPYDPPITMAVVEQGPD